MHSGEKSNRCNRCDFVSSRADNLRGAPNSKFLEKSRDFVPTRRGGWVVNESQVFVKFSKNEICIRNVHKCDETNDV